MLGAPENQVSLTRSALTGAALKTTLVSVFLALPMFLPCDALTQLPNEKPVGEIISFTDVKGRTFTNVKVLKVQPDGISYMFTEGTVGGGKVNFVDMPVDLQARYGYNPGKASDYQRAVESAQGADRARMAEGMRQAQITQFAEIVRRAKADLQPRPLKPIVRMREPVPPRRRDFQSIQNYSISKALYDEELGRATYEARQKEEARQVAAKRAWEDLQPAIAQMAMQVQQYNEQQQTSVSQKNTATGNNVLTKTPAKPADTTFYDFHGPSPLRSGTVDRIGNTAFYNFRGSGGTVKGTSDNIFGTTFYNFNGPAGTARGTSDSFGAFTFHNWQGPNGPGSGMTYDLGGFRFHDSFGPNKTRSGMSYDLGGTTFHDF
ncbi:MAG: hypothetical protein IH623_15005 [Verrucomicrobia bacterium]|nr:hypothetical protein [Verrucomicrobiota bacterium]